MNTNSTYAQTCISTAATVPATVTDVPFTGSSFAWSNPGNARVADGNAASAAALLGVLTGTTDYLQFTNLGFNIPSGSTVCGISVTIHRQAAALSITIPFVGSITGNVRDNIVQLIGPGLTGISNRASGANWPDAGSSATYGSSSDNWGLPLWTSSMVNDPGFGLLFSAKLTGGVLGLISLLPSVGVDGAQVALNYSLPTILPVSLQLWNATPQGHANLLNWSAPTSDGPLQFIVQRSADGYNWQDQTTITAITGQPTYQYTDDQPFTTGPSYYRLRLHPADGADNYSSILVLSSPSKTVGAVPSVSCYPNPFTDKVTVTTTRPIHQVLLRDLQGHILWEKNVSGGAGGTTTIPASGLSTGFYFVQVDGQSFKLVKNTP